MANRVFRPWVQAMMTTGGPNLLTADLRVIGVDIAEHDPDTTIGGDEFLSDIPAGARVTITDQLQNVTVVDGVFDADDIELPDSGGDSYEELVIYAHTGTEGTSRNLACIDTASGLPVTPDSVADELQWAADGIIALAG